MAPKFATIAAGLVAALGLTGVSRLDAQDPADAPSAATAKAPDKPIPDGPPTVLLLTSGKVLQGEAVQKTAAGYVVKMKFGPMLFERAKVERMFRSMAEVYAYKKSLAVENDPDDQFKLATWCIEQKLNGEARVHLQAVLDLSPENRKARAMLGSIDREVSPGPTRDDGVVRTGAEEVQPPAELTLNRLREEFARNPRAAGLPGIFDLDTPLAVKRAQEFGRFVHPILQRQCARCHNEQSQGDFQLIQARAARDMANDLVIRSNLESTLRIVDRDDLAHSPLLSASGMTHGNGGKPVLGGPNSPEYKVLSTWVNSLRAGSSPAPKPPATAPGVAPAEGFAAGRLGNGTDPAMPPTAKAAPAPRKTDPSPHFPGMVTDSPPEGYEVNGEPTAPRVIRPGSLIPGSADGMPSTTPPDRAFLTPDPSVPAPLPKDARGKAPAAPGGHDAEAPKTVQLPSGEIVPVVTPEMTKKEPTKASAKRKLNNKILEQMLKKSHKGDGVESKVPASGS